MTTFLVRERILIALHSGCSTIPQLQTMVRANRSTVYENIWRMQREGLVQRRRGGVGSGLGGPAYYSLTSKGVELARTQLWRMENQGITTMSDLPRVVRAW